MKKFLRAMSLLLITAASFSAAQASSIEYLINDYPALEAGYKISGSFTTDGTIGGLSAGNITAWTWTLSNSSGSTVYGTLSNANSWIEINSNVNASSTQITISPTFNMFDYNSLSIQGPTNGLGAFTAWRRAGPDMMPDPSNPMGNIITPAQDTFQGHYYQHGFFAQSNNPPGLTLTDVNNWVVASVATPPASVPEPSTFVAAVLGGLGLIVNNRLRRSKSIVA
jgi:hypothetical protein